MEQVTFDKILVVILARAANDIYNIKILSKCPTGDT